MKRDDLRIVHRENENKERSRVRVLLLRTGVQ